ncbi:MAG: Ig-like domain-containing protein [Patescibacteria group bacterium]
MKVKIAQKAILFSVLFFLLMADAAGAFFYYRGVDPVVWLRETILDQRSERDLSVIRSQKKPAAPEVESALIVEEKVAEEPVPEAKKIVIEVPPVPPAEPPVEAIVGETTENSDGSTTTVVAEGTVNQTDLNRVASLSSGSGDPYAIKFTDETGTNAALEAVVKDFLNSTLKWGSEISELREITVRDAGDVGWSGQYFGSYTTAPSGDITSAYGGVTLNVHYYKDSPDFNDYMKLIFSHEYGHHYTLYHKWVNGDLPATERFPDSYYDARPLSKTSTAVDYSLGWEDCEAEIIAEDYSYLYSGYDYHAMSNTYGYPSDPGTRNWLNDIANSVKAPTIADVPPTVALGAPVEGAVLSGSVAVTATAADDRQVARVDFYLSDALLISDATSPYETSFDSSLYVNGAYIIKAIVSDSAGQTALSLINVTIYNTLSPPTPPPTDTIAPSISFSEPETNPVAWTGGRLLITTTATDNVGVANIKLYINEKLVAEEQSGTLSRWWNWFSGAGQYTLRAVAADAAGNTDEATTVVDKL